ncbi:MAG: hypothetical protein CMQ11_00190 [Gammaproteobacteria bacterium]|nr:hypothetical protein [Gammaproteobacteria bacterium]
MIRHNVLEVTDPKEMWEEHDGTRAYILHGRQPSPFCKGIEIVDFSGAGILGGKYVRNLEDAQRVLAGIRSQEALLDIVEAGRGSLALHAFDHTTRDYLILNDPLGGGQIYLKASAGRTVISSDLNSLADVCKFRNEPLRKSLHYFMTQALTYTQTHGADTPYLDVALLRRGEGVRVSRSGEVELVSVSPPERLYFSGMSYREGMDAFVQDMLENVAKPLDHDFDIKVSHLTAGFDSRLVLAAMLKAGVADDFIYYCISSSADFEISRSLSGHFELRHTSSNDGNPRGRGWQRDYHEYVKNSPRATQFVLGEGIDFRYSPSNNLVFQGGYGELARTFNSFKWDGDLSQISSLAHSLWRWNGFPEESEVASSIWSKDYLDIVIRRLSEDIRRFRELGLPDDYFTNWFYIEKRNRLFIGARTYYSNHYRSQFDPIYSSHLAWLPATIDFYRRRSNFVGVDAMIEMSPLLASLPFDNEKIGPLYRQDRQVPDPTEFNGKIPEDVTLPNTLPETIKWPGKPTAISQEAAEAARGLRIPEIVAQGIQTMAPIAFDRLRDEPRFREVLNISNMGNMRNPLDGLTRERAQILHKVLSALVLADVV